MSALDVSRTFANVAYVVVAIALSVGLGFAGGFVVGSQGRLVDVDLVNSSIALNGDASFPCASDFNGNVRCTFLGANATWICASARPSWQSDARNESCEEQAG